MFVTEHKCCHKSDALVALLFVIDGSFLQWF